MSSSSTVLTGLSNVDGSSNIHDLRAIVERLEAQKAIIGGPGAWSLSHPHKIIAVRALAEPGFVGTTPTSSGDTSLADAAVAKSNAAASTTPSAASGEAVTSNTPIETIKKIAGELPTVASLPDDIRKLEAGATATLDWWGWTLDLNESATQAFENILTTDIAGFLTIAAALAPLSPALAAASGIISAVSGGLKLWMSSVDNDKHLGVILYGYLWVGVWVEGKEVGQNAG